MDCNTYPTYSHWGQGQSRKSKYQWRLRNLSHWSSFHRSEDEFRFLDVKINVIYIFAQIHESITVMKIWIPRQRDGFKIPSCLCDQSTEQQPLSCSAHRSVRIITLRLSSCCVTIGDSFLSAKQTAIHSCLDGSNNSTSMSAVMHVITTHFTNLDWLSMSNQASSNSFGI